MASEVTEAILDEATPPRRKTRASAAQPDSAKEASNGTVAKKRGRPGKKPDAVAKFRLEFDGGSRGNPGTGGFGAALRAQESGDIVGPPGVTLLSGPLYLTTFLPEYPPHSPIPGPNILCMQLFGGVLS